MSAAPYIIAEGSAVDQPGQAVLLPGRIVAVPEKISDGDVE